jgi:SAM-dependent methyltransferase
VTGYVHCYATPEQERLIATRLLDVGCGVGAVLAVLGQEYDGLQLTGVDIEARQLEFARTYLADAGVDATLVRADARALPFEDESFDHVWMMWFLEHVPEPTEALHEARRVLAPGGAITAIEVDYATCFARPSTPALEALFRAMVQGMAAAGWSDAGTRLPGWLREVDFRDVDEGERPFSFRDDDLARQASYAADVLESALPALAQVPGTSEDELRAGLADLRGLASVRGAQLGWVVHKSTARR